MHALNGFRLAAADVLNVTGCHDSSTLRLATVTRREGKGQHTGISRAPGVTALLLFTCAVLSAAAGCGSSPPSNVTGSSRPPSSPPSGLTYSTNPATYVKGAAVSANVPSSSGGAVVFYSVSPALPDGLRLDGTTGIISGTPTAATPTASYVVTATNSGGFTNATLTIAVLDVPGGKMAPTGNMATARAGHTATLLPDGKVFIAGGLGDGFEPLASTEIYDPSTHLFSPAGNMTTVRGSHTATLLPDGRVLIAAGSAEIYDPSTGTFTSTGNMISNGRAVCTLLQDGKVLIAENVNAEVYDPASGTFALSGPYADPSPVWVDTATVLADGMVLVTGCAAQCYAGASELYNPQARSFSLTGSRKAWDTVSNATLLLDGQVLLVEGNDSALPDDAEVYDPATRTFSYIGNTSQIHEFSAAARLADGTVLIAGGQLAGGNGNPATELYLPAPRIFAFAGNMVVGRHGHTATLLPDGTVLIAGGYSTWPEPTSSAEIYIPALH